MTPYEHDCYAVTHPGLETVLAAELSAVGLAPGAAEPGGVAFRTDLAGFYAANLQLRTASRVLLRIAEFPARTFAELERRARRLPWAEYLAPGAAVAFRVASRKSKLYHQEGVGERLGEAAERAVPGLRFAGDEAHLFVVRLHRDRCTISADGSGELLHRRGYRQAVAKAPLRETLAAAMLLAAGWDGGAPLVDPMCGSGTIAIEGALIARRVAPGLGRRFAFERWPTFEPRVWRALRDAARAACARSAPAPILASDRDAGAIDSALANAGRADVAGDIEFRRAALSSIEPPSAPGLVATNPPYGIRVGERRRLRDLYAQLGNVARRKCAGWRLVMLAAHRDLEAQVQIPFETLAATTNGGIKVRIVSGFVPGRNSPSSSDLPADGRPRHTVDIS